MTLSLHAHVSTASVGCDGPMYHDYVVVPNDDEFTESERANGVNDFSEIHFRQRVLSNCVSVYAVGSGGCKVEIEPSGDFMWHEGTDEGYRSGEAWFCDDDYCDTGQRSQRDVYAERMGY